MCEERECGECQNNAEYIDGLVGESVQAESRITDLEAQLAGSKLKHQATRDALSEVVNVDVPALMTQLAEANGLLDEVDATFVISSTEKCCLRMIRAIIAKRQEVES